MTDEPKKRPPIEVKPAEGTTGKIFLSHETEEQEKARAKKQE